MIELCREFFKVLLYLPIKGIRNVVAIKWSMIYITPICRKIEMIYIGNGM